MASVLANGLREDNIVNEANEMEGESLSVNELQMMDLTLCRDGLFVQKLKAGKVDLYRSNEYIFVQKFEKGILDS
jgi:hypothetical protein